MSCFHLSDWNDCSTGIWKTTSFCMQISVDSILHFSFNPVVPQCFLPIQLFTLVSIFAITQFMSPAMSFPTMWLHNNKISGILNEVTKLDEDFRVYRCVKHYCYLKKSILINVSLTHHLRQVPVVTCIEKPGLYHCLKCNFHIFSKWSNGILASIWTGGILTTVIAVSCTSSTGGPGDKASSSKNTYIPAFCTCSRDGKTSKGIYVYLTGYGNGIQNDSKTRHLEAQYLNNSSSNS